ncbi:MAG: HIT family protein, partial [Nanoarchaeota archaeon]|nr:HIT family protein [Nanoarchaeota archaeon]MBU1622878.1 HIT family protein [Nanoarchaeota archaeon]MBU1973880.1 HIT family protein [Nanoarchaeota archaeon]
MEYCIFCDHEKIKDDIIYETENFYVKVGISIITAGHVMITTKKHYRCYAEMPKELIPEFEQLKNKLITLITENFSKPFLVEYGIWGQTIAHAHIHLIPSQDKHYEIKSIIAELGIPSPVPFQEGTFQTMKALYKKNNGYVLLGENHKMFLFDIEKVKNIQKSDTLLDYRPFFAKKGIGTGSWKNMSEEEKLADEEKREKTKKLLFSVMRSS